MEVVAQHLHQRRPQQRRDRLLAEPRHEGVRDEVGDVVVADLAERDHGHLGHLVDHAPGVGRLRQPGPDPGGDRRGGHPLADDVLLEEVLPHELLEPLAQLVLALGHERGVRDRQAERVLEQRRHREPVGDRADHRRLGARVDEPPEPVAPQRGGVHAGSEQQQAHGDRPHPAQPAATGLVHPGIGRDQGDRRRARRGARRRASGGGGGGGGHASHPPRPCQNAAHASHRDHLRHVRRVPRRAPARPRARRRAG